MQSAAASAGQYISNAVTGAFNTIASGASDLWKWLTGGSVWTDMLNEMQSQTAAALGNIVGDFQGAFGSIALAAPEFTGYRAGGYEAPATAPALAAPLQTSITVPVQVQIDGATVTRTIETRLIRNRRARGGY